MSKERNKDNLLITLQIEVNKEDYKKANEETKKLFIKNSVMKNNYETKLIEDLSTVDDKQTLAVMSFEHSSEGDTVNMPGCDNFPDSLREALCLSIHEGNEDAQSWLETNILNTVDNTDSWC